MQPADQAIDLRRLGALTVYNGIYVGAFLHFLYQIYPLVVCAAARRVPSRPLLAQRLQNVDSPSHAISCAVVDFAHNNAIYVPSFFLGVGLLQGDRFQTCLTSLRREWVTAGIACSAFWFPFTCLNFYAIPTSRRVQAMATANLAWNVVIDYLAHRE